MLKHWALRSNESGKLTAGGTKIMLRPIYVALLAVFAMLVLSTGAAGAANKMPVGFFDDASFRWSPDALTNLEHAAAAGATVINTTASWASIVADGPQMRLTATIPRTTWPTSMRSSRTRAPHHMQVLINITGSPKWANGGLDAGTTCRRSSPI